MKRKHDTPPVVRRTECEQHGGTGVGWEVKVQLAQLQADARDLVEAGDDLSRMLIRLSYSTSALSAADKWVGNPVRQRNRWWK